MVKTNSGQKATHKPKLQEKRMHRGMHNNRHPQSWTPTPLSSLGTSTLLSSPWTPTVLNTHTPELTMDKQKLLHTHTHVWEHHTAQPKNQMPTWETRDSGFSGKKKYIFYYRDQFLEMYMLKWTMSNQFRILIPPTIFCRSHHHWRW